MKNNFNNSSYLIYLFLAVITLNVICCKNQIKQESQSIYKVKCNNPFIVTMSNSATLQKDTLTISCTIYNTSTKDIIILPSFIDMLGCTKSDEIVVLNRGDAMSVEILGQIHKALYFNEIIEGTLYYSTEYLFQFLIIECSSSVELVYKLPLKKMKMEKFSEFNYFNKIILPAWGSDESIFPKINAIPIRTKKAVFNTFMEKADGSLLIDGSPFNIGMQKWKQSLRVTKEEFDQLKDCMNRCLDTTNQKLYPIIKR